MCRRGGGGYGVGRGERREGDFRGVGARMFWKKMLKFVANVVELELFRIFAVQIVVILGGRDVA